MNKSITGILVTNKDVYFFRNDDHNFKGYVAWSIYDTSHKPKVYKWEKLPKGDVEYFDSENPPPTVRYIPELL